MKRLKLVLAVAVVASLFGAQSAFASKGWADTPGTANTGLFIGYAASAQINTADDVDWFVYSNNSGGDQILNPSLQSPAGQNLDLQVIYISKTGQVLNWTADDRGPGGTDPTTLYMTPGDMVYFKVAPKTSSDYGTGRYLFSIG